MCLKDVLDYRADLEEKLVGFEKSFVLILALKGLEYKGSLQLEFS
jgi:hypothetical protein